MQKKDDKIVAEFPYFPLPKSENYFDTRLLTYDANNRGAAPSQAFAQWMYNSFIKHSNGCCSRFSLDSVCIEIIIAQSLYLSTDTCNTLLYILKYKYQC